MLVILSKLTWNDGGEGHEVLLHGLDLVDVLRPLLGHEAQPLGTPRQLPPKQQAKLTTTLWQREAEG